VSNSLWAGATLKDVAPAVLKLVPALSAQVPVTAPNMNAQNVSNSLWAAATLSEAGLDLQEMVPAL
jgi:UDP-N-acetylmuramyl pentapeptide synthase